MVENWTSPEVICWTNPARAAFAAELLTALAGTVRPIGFGGSPDAATAQAAKSLELTAFDDLRQILVDTPPRYLLLADSESAPIDAIKHAQESGVRIITLDPIAASISELAQYLPNKNAQASMPALIPAFETAPSLIQAGEIEGHIGQRRLVKATSLGPISHRDLFTRLFDLWSLVLRFVDVPETVLATISGTGNTLIPESLRDLTGHIAIHAKGIGGASVLLHAGTISQEHEDWLIEVITEQGRFSVTDHGFHLINEMDDFEDQSILDQPGSMSFLDQCVNQWQRLIDRPPVHEPTHQTYDHHAAVLACCQACQLSARTGQAESPHTLLQMGR